jgi:hypothetical protein
MRQYFNDPGRPHCQSLPWPGQQRRRRIDRTGRDESAQWIFAVHNQNEATPHFFLFIAIPLWYFDAIMNGK